MATWDGFSEAAPELAAAGQQLLYRGSEGEAFLATVRGDTPPRIHPISIGIIDGRLVAFILPSAKRRDLETDGRFALHAHQDPGAPSEFSVRGRATPIADPERRASIARQWYFAIDESYELFEFSLESAVLGTRAAGEWPPAYTSWSEASRD